MELFSGTAIDRVLVYIDKRSSFFCSADVEFNCYLVVRILLVFCYCVVDLNTTFVLFTCALVRYDVLG